MLIFLIGYGNRDTKQMVQCLMKVCEDSNLLDERQMERRLSRLLMEASFSSNPTSVMMKRLMAMVTDMGMSLKPTVAGAFRAIITLDGTLSSVNPTFSLSAASQSYSGQINKGQLIKERISKVKGKLEDYVPKLLELPLLKDNRITIAREDPHSLQDVVSMVSVSIFTVICMIVMLTSFFVQGELMRFVLAPLSIAGFGVGMIVLMTAVIRQLRLKV